MPHYVHTISPIEDACGVTMEEVSSMLPQVLVRNSKVIFPQRVSAALASSVARCVFAGKEVKFLGMNTLGHPVYGLHS